MLSSAKLELLRVIEGSKPGAGFGAKVLMPETVPGKTRLALVSSELPASPGITIQRASIALLSLDTWTLVAEQTFALYEKLGRCGLAWIPDQDGDGGPDVAVGIVNARNVAGAEVGRVEIRSGRTLAVLRTIDGSEPGGEFGASLAPIHSEAKSSRFDLLIGMPHQAAREVQIDRRDTATRS
ncbi:MAG TPA: hypothetical protein VK843_10130 [Planctomycetota bacterium]|nr:hypothetical protein [Planctomycetota bacterium]